MGPHTAVVLEGVLKAVHWVQHTVGYRAHLAEVVLNMACWAKSSRKQAPACYTSASTPAGVKLALDCIGTRGPH